MPQKLDLSPWADEHLRLAGLASNAAIEAQMEAPLSIHDRGGRGQLPARPIDTKQPSTAWAFADIGGPGTKIGWQSGYHDFMADSIPAEASRLSPAPSPILPLLSIIRSPSSWAPPGAERLCPYPTRSGTPVPVLRRMDVQLLMHLGCRAHHLFDRSLLSRPK